MSTYYLSGVKFDKVPSVTLTRLVFFLGFAMIQGMVWIDFSV